MNFIPLDWRPEYETGIEEIDLQHRYFLRLINRLGKELVTTEDEHYRLRLLNELSRYTSFHFLSEENIMLKIGYPDFETHQRHHFELLDKLSSRAAGRPPESLLAFLADWFVHHTVHEDRRIGEFIQEQAVSDADAGER